MTGPLTSSIADKRLEIKIRNLPIEAADQLAYLVPQPSKMGGSNSLQLINA